MTTDFHDLIVDDFESFDNIEEVTFYPVTGSAVTGVSAIQQPMPIRMMSDNLNFSEGIGVASEKCIFTLFTATLDGQEPEAGTIEQADGTQWTIVGGQAMTALSRWRVYATKER